MILCGEKSLERGSTVVVALSPKQVGERASVGKEGRRVAGVVSLPQVSPFKAKSFQNTFSEGV